MDLCDTLNLTVSEETPDQRDVIQDMEGIAELIQLIRRDFEPSVAEKILGKNFYRVLKTVLG